MTKKGQKGVKKPFQEDHPENAKNPKKAKNDEKSTLYHFSRGGTLKRLRMYTPLSK